MSDATWDKAWASADAAQYWANEYQLLRSQLDEARAELARVRGELETRTATCRGLSGAVDDLRAALEAKS